MKALTTIAALFALFLSACAPTTTATTARPAGAAEGPAMWRVADEDTTIWLLGTIHALPQGYQWRTPAIDTAIDASDELVLETVLAGDPGEAAGLLMRFGVSPNLPPLAQRLPAESRPVLGAMIARGSLPESLLNGLESWAAGLMLVGVTLSDLEVNPNNGVEEQLQQRFRLADKPISGMETPAAQFGYFDGLSEEAQRFFLITIVQEPEDVRSEFAAMLEAWRVGDEAAIAATFDDDLVMSDELRNALLTRRNADWAGQIAARLDEPGTVFVAVGAGHLVGRDSVQHFLQRRGIEAVRVQ